MFLSIDALIRTNPESRIVMESLEMFNPVVFDEWVIARIRRKI
jgi:hypothetical protein